MATSSQSRGGHGDGHDPDPALLLEKLKRQTVPTACQNCRLKKVKCDGKQPCAYCNRRALHCQYEGLPDETPSQSRKRKFNEVASQRKELQLLYEALSGEDEARANDIFRRIRAGESPGAVYTYLQHGDPMQEINSVTKNLRRLFLFGLVESTASLPDIVSTASSVLGSPMVTLPPAETFDSMRNNIVTLPGLQGMVTAHNTRQSIDPPEAIHAMRTTEQAPPLWVPAEPWILGASDALVSHLISLFFSLLNHSWRYIEQDLFLQEMRNPQSAEGFCTPLLVHAILALATLYCDPNDDGGSAERYPERGLLHHDEAVRLWHLEEGRPSVANIQALMILATECILRGRDVQGFALLNSASNLNELLNVPSVSPGMSKKELQYVRARATTWWMAAHLDLTYKMSLLLGKNSIEWQHAPRLDDLLPNTTTYWVGYPYLDRPIPFRANLLLHHRCQFVQYLWEAVKILIWDASHLDGHQLHAEAVQGLSSQLKQWYDHLPAELVALGTTPPGQYDLHVQYHCVQMAIHERTYVQMFGPLRNRSGDEEVAASGSDEETRNYLRAKVLEHCFAGASKIRTFREAYGLKAVSFILLNHSVLGVFIALNELHARPGRNCGGSISNTGPIQNTQTALEEFFRVLLATSLRWTAARGFARTAYHTAMTMQVELPESITEMLKIMAESAWMPADLKQLDQTTYPNWSLPHIGKANAEEYRMGKLLREWEVKGPGTMGTTGLGKPT